MCLVRKIPARRGGKTVRCALLSFVWLEDATERVLCLFVLEIAKDSKIRFYFTFLLRCSSRVSLFLGFAGAKRHCVVTLSVMLVSSSRSLYHLLES